MKSILNCAVPQFYVSQIPNSLCSEANRSSAYQEIALLLRKPKFRSSSNETLSVACYEPDNSHLHTQSICITPNFNVISLIFMNHSL